jgi:hypothetical protein
MRQNIVLDTLIFVTDVADVDERKAIMFSAHRNVEENRKQIIRKYYWPSIHADIRNFVSRCETCQIAKYTRNPDKPEFQPTPIPIKPLQHF